MEDSVQIRCTRCKNVFRDRAKRLQSGYSRQCPSCEVVLFFDEDSPNPHIKKAMRAARRLRKEMRQMESMQPGRATAVSRRFSGRSASTAQDEGADDEG
ncbi:hypothetical protein H8A99_30345 [Bradyrhizobium sp. Arg68]|uniref:Zn-ribbon domain-containing protein n=1 Tax=Bradyrhizobium ivorense TaxID=2511166 RepID=UPI001E2BCB3E|nr:Zn-ribbon domain-containing protein [Bradyrhizobium ivorense]MCC8940629.1 hypothetical protein [Bradyrhizobium ivorense]